MRSAINKVLVCLMLSLSLFTGCKTKKGVTETTKPLDFESIALVSSSPSVVSSRTSLSGNLKLTATVDGKPLSVKGTVRIKENCGVQIGLTALGLVEIACLEFLPENMRLIYKLGKEFADVPYADVSFLQKTGIDYKLLESVLMNRTFSPDKRPFLQAVKEMEFSHDGNSIVATTRETKGIVYKFYIDKLSGELVRSVGRHVDGGEVVCHYSDFRLVDENTFPHKITLTIDGVGSLISLDFSFSRIKMNDINFVPRQIPASYSKMNIEKMLKSIGNK